MVRRYLMLEQSWITALLAVLLFCTLALSWIATPGDLAYKPIRKDPPWPSACPMAPDTILCRTIF